ncbi:Choline/glycine/betaine transporter [Corynebacterium glyciniphilum AJ 3170]|uniref:Choline/glycine/betaine transporter n=2 Tax=Corynebacterium TaxID=1716 RepID=X5DU81_9CORY|nr:Choline/glycine/betaine transporter [Corynebacterium glyciniphilum AJ 3170]
MPESPEPTSPDGYTPVADSPTPPAAAEAGRYPDDMHPGLVPGISVDDQRNRFGLDKAVFFITAALILSFIAWGISSPTSVSNVSSTMFAWAIKNVGWLLNVVMVSAVVLMLYLAFSRFGRIKLGTDDEEPEFSRFAWIAMMFGAGLGVGIFFFGPSEPLTYYMDPPPHTTDPETPEALHRGLAQAHFHWGLAIWGLYAMVGGALAYSSYRRGRVSLFSSAFRSLFGERQTTGLAGRLVDMMAIIATLFGTAATLGLSALQISEGIQIVSGASRITNTVLIMIIAVLTLCFIISAVSGVARGIRYLSNINISLTLGLVLFTFILGPTLFLLNLVPSGIMAYADNMLDMMGRSLSWGDDTLEFQSVWTAFYWAWWIAWTPFVGLFIARISRGRTIREFALVTTLAPTFILILAFTIFGGTAISFFQDGREGMNGESSPEQVLFAMFDNLPLSSITPFIIIFVLAIFFITSADSASLVMGTLSERGNPAPNKLVVVFWGLCMMGIAVVMLLTGGETALTGLQNLTILIAIPFSVVLIGLAVAFVKDLSTDPAAIRRDYARSAIQNAVVKGMQEHGDDFEFSVARTEDGAGAGAHFDSTADKITDWYRRTDEDGNDVGYDYGSGEWADGWTPEDGYSTSSTRAGRVDDVGDEDADGDPTTPERNRD